MSTSILERPAPATAARKVMRDKPVVVHLDLARVAKRLVTLTDRAGFTLAAYHDWSEWLDEVDQLRLGAAVAAITQIGEYELKLLATVRRRAVGVPLVVLTGQDNTAIGSTLTRLGTVSALSLVEGDPAIEQAIKEAVLLSFQNREERRELAEFADRLAKLSDKEREVLDMLMNGLTNRQIGEALGLTTRAIESRRRTAMLTVGHDNLPTLARQMERLEMSHYRDWTAPLRS